MKKTLLLGALLGSCSSAVRPGPVGVAGEAAEAELAAVARHVGGYGGGARPGYGYGHGYGYGYGNRGYGLGYGYGSRLWPRPLWRLWWIRLRRLWWIWRWIWWG